MFVWMFKLFHNLFSILLGSGLTFDKFSLDPVSGLITLVKPLDFETTTTHTIVVTARDPDTIVSNLAYTRLQTHSTVEFVNTLH